MRSLEESKSTFYRRAEALRQRFHGAAPLADQSDYNAVSGVKFSVISLVDAWADFNRSIIIESALGNICTSSGIILPRGTFKKHSDCLAAACTNWRGQVGSEPRWHDSLTAIATARRLNISNFNTVSLALGAVSSPADQMRLVRNYFCHERSDCAEKVRTAPWFQRGMSLEPLGITGITTADGRTNFDVWIDELELIASAATS
jgi:hypothetical protein